MFGRGNTTRLLFMAKEIRGLYDIEINSKIKKLIKSLDNTIQF